METTKNKLSPYAEGFFKRLSNYLDTKLYFFGSIQRNDFIVNGSDIDVDIFTDNEASTISKLQNFLNLKKENFKKIVLYTYLTKKVVYGHKITYDEPLHNLSVEICIFNENVKEYVLKDHKYKTNLPFYVSFFLIIIKTLYYKFGILPKKIYMKLKRFFMDNMINGEKQDFIVFQ